jgi:trehalose 6-phosphate phosphatase
MSGVERLPVPPWPSAERTALFLDIDGTLANFERLPDEVGPTPRRTALLKSLSRRLEGRVAMISGRALADMDRITEGAIVAASGVHGLEHRRADGSVDRAPAHPGVEEARRTFQALLQDHPALVLEDKGLGLVLHYRAAPELEAAAHRAADQVVAETGLVLQRGDMMAEVRTPGRNKGDALAAFMAQPPFAGHAPLYIGDDLTDEHAFEAAHRHGGFGVLVGPERETAARCRLATVEAVLVWLDALAHQPEAQAAPS